MSDAFRWEDFYTLACQWMRQLTPGQVQHEAVCRSIISRAYYAVLQSCRDHTSDTTRPLAASGDSHGDVILWFFRGSSDEHKEIGQNLDRLRKSRRHADYHITWRVAAPQFEAQNSLYYANLILNALGGLEPEPAAVPPS